MSSSVVVLKTKAASVSLARPVHARTHTFLETPVTQAKRGSFVSCPQPRTIFSLYVLFSHCRPCEFTQENYFFQMPKLVI